MFIYLDESGDLGFGPKASKYFVIAAILTENPLPAQKCITKIRKERLKTKYKEISELKYHNSDNIIRRRILQCITKTDVNIAYAILRKRQVNENLRSKKNILYNFLCGSLIGKMFKKYHMLNKVNIVVDRSLTKINREAFNEYIGYKALMSKSDLFNPEVIEVKHIDSCQDKCIQSVDFIVGAVARKYERNDSTLYEIIDHKIEIALDFFDGPIK